MTRAGLYTLNDFVQEMAGAINTVLTGPGRQIRTPVEMSQFAPFVDAATSIDRTSFSNTFISYYTWGEAIGLGLDLTLRDRSDGRVTLDDFMRELWVRHGRPGINAQGYVERPYTMADLKAVLAAVSGDAAFADDFFARHIEGHDAVDYAPLLARAGLVLRPAAAGRAFAGELPLQDGPRGARVAGSVSFGSPAYDAGLERDDIIVSAGGARVTSADDFDRAVTSRKPGTVLPIAFERRGEQVTGALRLVEDPRQELVPAEQAGQTLTEAQRQFRDAWLRSVERNAF
jgi:predicted metalloprotease with PDZ domain